MIVGGPSDSTMGSARCVELLSLTRPMTSINKYQSVNPAVNPADKLIQVTEQPSWLHSLLSEPSSLVKTPQTSILALLPLPINCRRRRHHHHHHLYPLPITQGLLLRPSSSQHRVQLLVLAWKLSASTIAASVPAIQQPPVACQGN